MEYLKLLLTLSVNSTKKLVPELSLLMVTLSSSDIIARVLQGDILAPYLFSIVLAYVMRQAINGREEELGFELERRRSRHHPSAVRITDLDFADDIALLSEEINQAQELLNRVETEAAKVGLHVNAKKTGAMPHNHQSPVIIKTRSGNPIKEVDNFKWSLGPKQ